MQENLRELKTAECNKFEINWHKKENFIFMTQSSDYVGLQNFIVF